MQKRVAELKKSVMESRVSLMKYQWTQAIDISIKGKTRKDDTLICRYGTFGLVERTPVSAVSGTEQSNRLRDHLVAKKADETKEYVDRLKSLLGHYAQPQPEMMKETMQAGNANPDAEKNGTATFSFANYYKRGDMVTFGFDTATKRLRSFEVSTYLDDPKKDIVTLSNQFSTLPDGTDYVVQTVLNAKARQIIVTGTNTNYSLIAKSE